MKEVELKFHIPPHERDALREAFMAASPTRSRLTARYFDAPDGALARLGLSLRVRKEDAGWVQTLKAREDSPVARLEHNVPIAPASSPEPAPDLTQHQHIAAIGKLSRSLVLQEVCRTDVDRHVVSLHQGGTTVEVSWDAGHLEAGGSTRVVSEIEFELKQGRPMDLVALAIPWVQRHGLWLDLVSKGERGQLLAQGASHAKAARAVLPKSTPTEPRRFVRHVVALCLEQVLRNSSEIAHGSDDPDHVHQMRVGLRRLARTALRELPPLNACLDPGWEAPLADAFRELGRQRDQTLLATKTADRLVQAGAPTLRRSPSQSPGPGPAERVGAGLLQTTLLTILCFSMAPVEPEAQAYDGDAIDAVATRLDQLQRRLRKSAKGFADMSADDQHAVRKRLKRLRYLAEFVAPAFRRSKVSDYFEHLKPAQDALGEHNDEATALAHFRAQAADDPEAWFAVGWLTARQAASARASAKALRRAARARPFWHDKPARR